MRTKQPPTAKMLRHKMNNSFKRFRLGLALFFCGLVILYAVDQLAESSLYQEIIAAIAIFVIAFGFSLAFVAELLFIGYRVWLFFSSK